jgi:hypothetical protein
VPKKRGNRKPSLTAPQRRYARLKAEPAKAPQVPAFISWRDDLGEDGDDLAIREAHGFAYEDDYRDRTLLCRNGCGVTYYEIAIGKIRECLSAPGSDAPGA